jgi:hypothetical protein
MTFILDKIDWWKDAFNVINTPLTSSGNRESTITSRPKGNEEDAPEISMDV